jgi:ABC-type polysaccharide/polyol phosphate transport system ATPase subunit
MIETANLGKCYRIYNHPFHRVREALKLGKNLHREFWALKNIYLHISRGASFGIIGPNGAGKSTFLKLLSGITQPTEGTLTVNGTVASILELGAGFHHDFTGRSNVYLNCALQGYTHEDTNRILPEIIEFAELHDFIDQPVRMYSTGMYLRLAFSVATAVDPDILVVDEALSVGDEYFRNKCLDRMNEFKAKGKTILIVSHDLATIRHFCTHVALFDQGNLLAAGSPEEILDQYLEMAHKNRILHADQRSGSSTSPRWGTGEVQVEQVYMRDANGQTTDVFDTNSPITITANFRVHRPVKGVVFGFLIFRSDGTYVNGSNHYWHDTPQIFHFENDGEIGQIQCEITRFPLLPGHYYITSCCYNNLEGFPQAVDHWERALTFTISERMTGQHGVIAMDTAWNLQRQMNR